MQNITVNVNIYTLIHIGIPDKKFLREYTDQILVVVALPSLGLGHSLLNNKIHDT